jgi:hypothetical protein
MNRSPLRSGRYLTWLEVEMLIVILIATARIVFDGIVYDGIHTRRNCPLGHYEALHVPAMTVVTRDGKAVARPARDRRVWVCDHE